MRSLAERASGLVSFSFVMDRSTLPSTNILLTAPGPFRCVVFVAGLTVVYLRDHTIYVGELASVLLLEVYEY